MAVLRASSLLALIGTMILAPVMSMAGPWPRAEGSVFIATSTEVWIAPDGLPAHYSTGYVEYGATPKLSFGAVLSNGTFSGYDTEVFAGWNILKTGPHALSIEMSLTHHIHQSFFGDVTERTGAGLGLAYGRGLSLGKHSGWASLETTYKSAGDVDELKIDATFGIAFANDWKVMAQVFSSRIDNDTHVKLAPGLVIPINYRFDLEFGLRVPVDDPDLTAVRLGLWQEF
ncbi:hypothetical protein ACS3SW_08840 [Roseobacteraceae bacterium S113]